jgi:hypothetical protein
MDKIIKTVVILAAILTNSYGQEGKILKDFFRVSQNAAGVYLECRPNDLEIDFAWTGETTAEKQKKQKYKLNPNIANQEILFMSFFGTGKADVNSRDNAIGKLTVLDEYTAQFNWLEKHDFIIFRQIKLLPTVTKNPKNKTLFKKEEIDVILITGPENIMVTDPFNHTEYRCKLTAEYDLE